MNLIERAKNILITPKTEWDVVSAENTAPATLVTGYVLPLALIPAIAGFIGSVFIGYGFGIRLGLVAGISIAVMQLVSSVIGVFLLALIISELAPTFGGQKNFSQAFKVAVYSYTPAWLGGIFSLIPLLGVLGILAALYGLYLLYLGLPKLMRNSEDKTIGYTAVVVIAAIVLSVVIGAIVTLVGGVFGGGAALLSGMGRDAAITIDKDSALGKLENFSKGVEAAGKKLEAAQKSGDQNAQAAAALEALGTAFSGGKKVDPVELDVLKPLIPETFAGLPRKATKSERSGIGGIMVAKVEADYNDGAGKRAELEITDTGGASGLLGLASWAAVTGEKEDEQRIERTRKEGGRVVHEVISKREGGNNKFELMLAGRFMVSASGNGVDINALKAAVASIDLAKLESMKDVGVAK